MTVTSTRRVTFWPQGLRRQSVEKLSVQFAFDALGQGSVKQKVSVAMLGIPVLQGREDVIEFKR